MRIYPAIDLKDGNCVRLLQGRPQDATVYGADPVAMATRWAEEGAEYLHVVDLDGAFTGKGKNLEAVSRICKTVGGLPVQLGGGIRTMEDIEKRLVLGVARVILGTAAISDPEFTAEAAKCFPEQIMAGIDAKDGFAAVRGWVEVTKVRAAELAKQLRDLGISTCVYTDISKDGMLQGPNLEATLEMQQQSGMELIASGGIGSLEDIRALKNLGIHGAITGKALYDGRIRLSEAIAAAKEGE